MKRHVKRHVNQHVDQKVHRVGDFILKELLHSGRATEVWKAEWLKAPAPQYKLVALKILSIQFSLDVKEIKRFNNEILTTSKLRHPHIAAPMAWGAFDDGQRYFATQFIEGRPLTVWLDNSPLDFNFALSILHQIAAGLDYVHRNDVVHRDIKPENILITPEGKSYLVDFSVALSREVVRMTIGGQLVGTAAYMAPEIISGRPMSSFTDIYSLGVLAFQMLTGRLPFEGQPVNVTYQHVNHPPPKASEINPSLWPAIDQTLDWALKKDPHERPQLASLFVNTLQIAIETGKWEPQQPRTPSIWLALLLGLCIACLIIVVILAVIAFFG